jgi:hypothetical protein
MSENTKHCQTKYCRGVCSPGGRSPYCGKCRARQFRANHPVRAHFNNLRNRARARGHEFTISFAEYEKFWFESGYGAKHGKTKESFSIDRIRPELGYVPGNIRAKTLSENARLRFVPYFSTKSDEQAAVMGTEDYNRKCQEIADALSKIYPEDSDEWISEYTLRTNNLKPME